MSHIGQEEGLAMEDTMSMADTWLKRIGASCSHSTPDTSSRKEYKKYGSDKLVHDEGDDAISSHQKTMLLVQSHISQEEGLTTMVDNVSMGSPAQVTQNTTE